MTANPARDAINQRWVVGIPNGGPGYPRLEIDDFCQDYARLNLYLLALEQLQSNDRWRDDMWCWFQVQGIHGAPNITWDGVDGSTLYKWFRANKKKSRHRNWGGDTAIKRGSGNRGYCNHSSVLFPTWHRGYAAMIEQAIQAIMVEIADSFVDGMMPGEVGPPGPESLKWQSVRAAKMFRQPYWDPFRARAGRMDDRNVQMGLSLILAVKQVKVTRPDLSEDLIDNPLYSYEYPVIRATDTTLNPRPARGESGAMEWAGHDIGLRRTARHPTGASGESDNVEVQRALEGPNNTIIMGWMETAYHVLMLDNLQGAQTAVQGDRIYHRFSTTDWELAEERAKGRPGTEAFETLSLEAWHNAMHTILGGDTGTMSDPTTAGHDPVFLLHHANVDRHFVLWQALHPEPWLGENSMASTNNTFTALANTWEGARTPLLPFRKPPPPTNKAKAKAATVLTTFWSSEDLRDHTVLGYQIEEAPAGPDWDPPRRIAAARRAVNRRLTWWRTDKPSGDPVRMDGLRAIPQPAMVDGTTEFRELWTVREPSPRLNLRRAIRDDASSASEDGETEDENESVVVARRSRRKGFASIPGTDTATIFTPGTMDANGRVPLWFFNFRALRHAVGTGFTVYVFLGNFPPDSHLWHRSPSLVLALPQFIATNPDAFERDDDDDDDDDDDSIDEGYHAGPHEQQQRRRRPLRLKVEHRTPNPRCENCAIQEERGAQIAGGAPLTRALLRYLRMGREVPLPHEVGNNELPGVRLESLDPGHVVPFLKRNLHWRVLRSDGEELYRGDIGEFKAFVTHRFMTLPKRDEDAPVYEPLELRWDVTDQRPGGLCSGEVP